MKDAAQSALAATPQGPSPVTRAPRHWAPEGWNPATGPVTRRPRPRAPGLWTVPRIRSHFRTSDFGTFRHQAAFPFSPTFSHLIRSARFPPPLGPALATSRFQRQSRAPPAGGFSESPRPTHFRGPYPPPGRGRAPGPEGGSAEHGLYPYQKEGRGRVRTPAGAEPPPAGRRHDIRT